MLAVISWPNGGNNMGASLLLIDLGTWIMRSTGVVVNDSVLGPFFSPDGSALWWADPGWHDRAHGVAREYALVRYDLAGGQAATAFTFAESFEPWQLRPMRDGQHLAVFGVPTSTDNLAEDTPRVQVIDTVAGALSADLPLDGLKAGQFQVGPPDGPDYPYHQYRPGLAWDIGRGRLYMVYPDEERVSVVDLGAGKIIASELMRPRTSWLQQLLARLVPAVEAKSVPTTQRWAVLSPDGSRLYVSGSREEGVRVDTNNSYDFSLTEEGLRVVDTNDLAEIARRELSGSAFAVAPDGRLILVHTFRSGLDPAKDRWAADQHQARILAADGLTDASTLDVADAFYLRGFSPDGKYAYVEQPGGSLPPATVFRVVDVGDGHVVAERSVAGYYAALLLNPSGGPDL